MPQNDSFRSSEILDLQLSSPKLAARSRVQAQADLVLYLAEDLAALISCQMISSSGCLVLDDADDDVIPSLKSLNTALLGLNELLSDRI